MDLNFYGDVPATDPFMSLETNLDDISNYLGPERMDYDVDQQWQQPGPSQMSNGIDVKPQLSPPQDYYESENKDVGSLVSLLNRPSDDYNNYSSMKFSPPNFDMTQQSSSMAQSQPLTSNGPASMLPNLNRYQPRHQPQHAPENNYRTVTLAQQLAAPAMQPATPLFVNTKDQCMASPPITNTNGYYSPPHVQQPVPQQNGKRASNTKEELLRLLANMSPTDVERLKRRKSAEKEADEDEDDSDSGDMSTNNIAAQPSTSTVKRGPKTERRTAHNLIEKKYRCSINDRIQHLKVILAGDEAKLSKSATLRKAIDHIAQIDAENAVLRRENEKLRNILNSHGLSYPAPEYTDPQMYAQPLPPQQPQKKRRAAQANDSSRLTLFAMLMAVLIFNPLGLLTSGVGAAEPKIASPFEHGRILDDSSLEPHTPSFLARPVVVWIVNVLVILCVLMRLLVYGEPVKDVKSGAWSTFLATRQRARDEQSCGNWKEAQRQFCECLVALDRELPSHGIDATLSVVWECVRHLLNWLWIGRWMARRRRSTTTPVSMVCRSHAHTAVLYHEIHQLHLLGVTDYHDEEAKINGLYLALSAVNLAEAAGASTDGLPRSVLAQIYVAASIRCRLDLPRFLAPIVSGYFMRRARRHIRRATETSVAHLLWLFHPSSRTFLSDPNRVEKALTSKQPARAAAFVIDDTASPLARLRTALKVHLMSLLVGELVGAKVAPFDDEIDVVDVSRLLITISTKTVNPLASNEKDEAAKFGDWLNRDGDALCTWWTHLLTCGIYWRSGKNEMARKHYSLIRNCPDRILKDHLGLAVGHALCARKICIDDRGSSNVTKYVCIHSRNSLESLRAYASSRTPSVISDIQEGVRRMAYEWIMNSLLDAWRTNLQLNLPYWRQKVNGQRAFSTLYQEAYNHYAVINGNRGDSWRLFVYELTSRMLNGANPQATWSGIRRVRSTKIDAVRGRVSMKRSIQPDAFHLHTLCKLHSSMEV